MHLKPFKFHKRWDIKYPLLRDVDAQHVEAWEFETKNILTEILREYLIRCCPPIFRGKDSKKLRNPVTEEDLTGRAFYHQSSQSLAQSKRLFLRLSR